MFYVLLFFIILTIFQHSIGLIHFALSCNYIEKEFFENKEIIVKLIVRTVNVMSQQ